MNRLAVFAYGSLASPASAGETLGRTVEIAAWARLAGWARRWTLVRDNNTSEKTFARPDGSLPRFCLGLTLERAGGAEDGPNGALIELTDAELERLDRREIRYERIEVTDAVNAQSLASAGTDVPGFDAVYAYTARASHHRPIPPAGSVLVAAYLRTVESAFETLGPGQLELFRSTTPPPAVEVIEATLVADRIAAGNPRAW